MKRLLLTLFICLFASTAWANTYDYPFVDAYEATVLGTPDLYAAPLPKKVRSKMLELTVFEDRDIPAALWYQNKLRYSLVYQKKKAPLIFVIAGTGASFYSSKMLMLQEAFYKAGFHVISLSSPTHPNFIVTASTTSIPGFSPEDSRDLYRVMELAWQQVKKRIEVSNFTNNLHEVTTLINSLLQFKGQKASLTVVRMLINTTAGIGGLFDVATNVEIAKQNEDFGQTLGFYGLGPGPYFVLPVFGPSTLRDAGGLEVDTVTYSLLLHTLIDELDMDHPEEDILKWGLTVLDAIDTRHQQQFRYYATGSPFEYDPILMLYLEKRMLDIEN